MKHNVSLALETAGVADDRIADRMCQHLMSSKSDSTVKKYFGNFKKWQDFCTRRGYTSLPAQPILIAVYLTELLDSGASHHAIGATIYSIKWAHEMNGLVDPTNNSFVKNLY